MLQRPVISDTTPSDGNNHEQYYKNVCPVTCEDVEQSESVEFNAKPLECVLMVHTKESMAKLVIRGERCKAGSDK